MEVSRLSNLKKLSLSGLKKCSKLSNTSFSVTLVHLISRLKSGKNRYLIALRIIPSLGSSQTKPFFHLSSCFVTPCCQAMYLGDVSRYTVRQFKPHPESTRSIRPSQRVFWRGEKRLPRLVLCLKSASFSRNLAFLPVRV